MLRFIVLKISYNMFFTLTQFLATKSASYVWRVVILLHWVHNAPQIWLYRFEKFLAYNFRIITIFNYKEHARHLKSYDFATWSKSGVLILLQ